MPASSLLQIENLILKLDKWIVFITTKMNLIKRVKDFVRIKADKYFKLPLGFKSQRQYAITNRIYPSTEGNVKIYDKISSCGNEGLMISRFGSTELSTIVNYLSLQTSKVATWDLQVKTDMQVASGFFPITPQSLENFSKIYLDSIRKIDVLGVWYRPYEDLIIKNYCPNALLTDIAALEPYYHREPWSRILTEKNILVIHPFEKTIIKQYSKRKNIFKNRNVLPDFKLITLRSVQSLAYNEVEFADWFSALNYMKDQISKIDFDIAIIGCGAYGLPLAAYIKEIGKIGIHLGGATQVLFGIKGKRWDNFPKVSKLYNEYWSRPLTEETPEKASSVEQGCYW